MSMDVCEVSTFGYNLIICIKKTAKAYTYIHLMMNTNFYIYETNAYVNDQT